MKYKATEDHVLSTLRTHGTLSAFEIMTRLPLGISPQKLAGILRSLHRRHLVDCPSDPRCSPKLWRAKG